MKTRLLLALLGVVWVATAVAQAPPAPQATAKPPVGNMEAQHAAFEKMMQPQVISLWEQGAPGAVGNDDSDRPTITMYRPTSPGARALNSGLAVIIAPGGGYMTLATSYEGIEEAYWLNSLGATAFVLKYRLAPRYKIPTALLDAQRAIRSVRSRAASLNIQPDRIGMMGFSAGGHLSAMAGTHFDSGDPSAADPIDRMSSRPDFLVLGYALISLTGPESHTTTLAPLLRMLLGDNPDPKQIDFLSAELHVTPETPPTFLFATTNDQILPVSHSVEFYMALIKAHVPAEMHLFGNGPHGAGMGLHDLALGMWPTLLENWLKGRGLLSSVAAAAPAR